MNQSISAHFIYNLANASIRLWPFPHLYFENAFPDEFYSQIQESMPEFETFEPIGKVRYRSKSDRKFAYKDRYVISFNEEVTHLKPPWQTVQNIFRDQNTGMAMLGKFEPHLREQLADLGDLVPDGLLIKDRRNYSLGPHTDQPHRLIVLLLYLPSTDADPHLGTSLYVPKEEGFTCDGGPHYPHDRFHKIFTAPYKPNSAFAFVKTNNSFHGVEPVDEGKERNLFHFFIGKVNG